MLSREWMKVKGDEEIIKQITGTQQLDTTEEVKRDVKCISTQDAKNSPMDFSSILYKKVVKETFQKNYKSVCNLYIV